MNKKKKLHIIVAAVFAAAVIAQFVLLAVSVSSSSQLPSQSSDDRWSGDGTRYAQISCFISPDEGFSAESIMSVRESMEAALTENSIKSEYENARLWIFAYSAETSGYISSSRGGLSVNVTATGEDFFALHPAKLISGSYYNNTLLTDEHIVIDENAAWTLFGSNDVAGLAVTVNGTEFVVTGVVEPENNDEYTSPHVYLPMSVYEKAGNAPAITCLEFLLPNPVSGFAMGLAEKCMTVTKNNIQIIDNTARFDMFSLYGYIGSFKNMLIGNKLISYPFWEQTERLTEFKCAMLLLCRTFCFALIICCFLTEFVVFYINKGKIFAAIKAKTVRKLDDLDRKKRMRKLKPARTPKIKEPKIKKPKAEKAKKKRGVGETENAVQIDTETADSAENADNAESAESQKAPK